MSMYGGRRSQAERDAITVEIGYALFSAAFAAAVVFGAVVGPAYAFDLSAGARRTLVGAGATAAALLFVARVASVLLRFGQRRDTREGAAQPSQPGRTNPDS
ncbi:DUF6332 family protein [Streptomyces bicolor]|uniref:DUF6332 family protein n=1 Tax=Streptomyces bicolor TaxID=66874 RepID=UPI0004E18465|nr:DUF6332 family protein [Streptomyces bicolor]